MPPSTNTSEETQESSSTPQPPSNTEQTNQVVSMMDL